MSMHVSKSVVKEIFEAIAVFIFSVGIVSSSFTRGDILIRRDYAASDLIAVLILASGLTIAYILFKRKYAKYTKVNKKE